MNGNSLRENGSEGRIQKRPLSEGIESDSKLLDLPGIVDPSTGKILTVGEAIKLHLLDVRTGEVLLISGERMSLQKAAEQRLINPEVALKLTQHLDAAQRELSEAEGGNESAEKRIKVTTSTATISSPVKTIADAIKDGTVDAIAGVYKLPDGSTITITDAYQRGLLIKNETVKIKSTPLCLADAIAHGLVDQAGWVVDRNAGDKFRLDSAIANGLILPHFQEVVDTRNDVKVSVTRAVEMGLLNAKTGRYINPLTKEKLTFIEAKNRQLIVRPMTLKDVCDLNLMDREGLITSPTRKGQLTILEAIKVGILDGDEIQSISKGDDDDDELLTLNEAIGQGIVGVGNKFKNATSGATMTVQEAVDDGLISSVTQKSIFDIAGFKNPHSGEFVSLNEALANDVLVRTGEGFKLETGQNKLVSLADGISANLVRPELNEMLNRRVGVFDERDHEISVLDLVLYELIDPKTGYLLDYNKTTIVPLNHAVERKMITPEGGLLLSSLLNITLTTETVSKVEKRYITIANTQVGDYSEPAKGEPFRPVRSEQADDGLQLADAIKQNVFDPSTGVFTIPNTDRLVSFEECIKLGLINPESMRIVDPKYKEEITVHRAFEKNILDTTGHYRSSEGWVPMDQGIETGLIILNKDQPSTSTKALEFSHSPKSTPMKTPELEVTSPEPVEISPGIIYDPSTALVINMKTGKSENLLKAVQDNLVDSELVQVVDPTTGNPISFKDAISKGILSPQSGEVCDPSGRKINLIDAVKTGLLVVAGAPLVAAAGAINSLKMVFDPSTNQHIPVELAYERGLVSRDEISDFTISDIPRSAVISQASSFDIPTPKDMSTPSRSRRHSGLYEDEDSVSSDFKPTPVPRKSITESVPNTPSKASNLLRQESEGHDSVDKTGDSAPQKSLGDLTSQVTVNEALQRGLLDLKNGTYLDPSTNKVVPIQEAVNKGLIVSTSDSVAEEILNISPTHETSTSSKVSQLSEKIPTKSNEKVAEGTFVADKEQKVWEKEIPAAVKDDENSPRESDTVNESKFLIEDAKSGVNFSATPSQKSYKEIDMKADTETKPGTSHEISEVLPVEKLREASVPANESRLSSTEAVEVQNVAKINEKTRENSEELRQVPDVETEGSRHHSGSPPSGGEVAQEKLDKTPTPSTLEAENNSQIVKSTADDSAKPQAELLATSSSLPTRASSSQVSSQPGDSAESKISGADIANAAKLGLMAIVGAPVLAGMAVADSVKNLMNKPSDEVDQLAAAQHLLSKPPSGQDVMVFSTIQEMSESTVSDVFKPKPQELKIDEKVSPEELEKFGAFDKRTGSFIDPSTGNKVPFDDFIYNCGVFNPESIYVKDLSNDNYVPLAVALEKVLIDRHTGIMVDPKSGKRIPFFECLKRQWIIQQEPPKAQALSLEEARLSGLMDEDSGKVAVDGILLPINEALNSGVLDVDSISIRDLSGEVMPLTHAIETGVVDLKRGVIIDPKTGKTKPLEAALRDGSLIEGIKCPISLEAVVKSGLYDRSSGKIKSQNALLDVQEAIIQGLVDANISEVKNTQLSELVPLQKAIDDKLVEAGCVKNTKIGDLVPFDEAVEQRLISTKSIQVPLIDAIVKEFYQVDTQKILNPMTGELQSLEDGIKCGLIDIATTLVVDEGKDRVLPAKAAIECGLVDAKVGRLTNPDLNLSNAYQRGFILSSKKPISLSDAIVRGIYDPNTGKLRPGSAELSLEECIKAGEISSSDLIIHDPKSNDIISVSEAIKCGLLDAKHGCVNEPFTSEKLSLNDAVDRGIIILSKRKCSLPEAVFKGLYDPQSGTFANTTTTEKLSTERAIKRGFIDPQSTVVNIGGKILPFELSVENGMVDTKRGTITDEFGNKVDFREAFDRGILVEVRKPIGLYEALVKGIYDEESGRFMDPQSGKRLTLEQAISEKLIDPNSVQIKETAMGGYRDLPLLDAINTGVIDEKSRLKVDSRQLTLKQAFDLGILSDNKAPISIQRAIHQGIYDSQSGKIVDPSTEKKMTLHEAMRRWIINPQLPCYFNESEECLLSLGECCRQKMIDRREGVFKEPGSNVFVPLNEAMGLGLIVDIESGGFGLYELLAMKLYDPETGKFINPSNGRAVTMADAIEDDLISLVSSLVKDTTNGAYLRLNDGIKANLIDVMGGRYVYPDGKKIDLQEARRLGLIVSQQKLLSLENAIKMGLYRPETGKLVDPSTNEEMDLKECIDMGLIDGDTTVVKNFATGQDKPLRSAIECGDVDVGKGRVNDAESRLTDNFDTAFKKGLMFTVLKPITGKSIERNESFENILRTDVASAPVPKELSLEEAIKLGIIDAETAVVKDPKTGQFRPLSKAMDEQKFDVTKRIAIDPSAPFFAFDPTCVVYSRTPESFEHAVESGHLNLSDGSYNNPKTAATCNLKEAIASGLIDPESALIKDGAKNKMIRLPDAFRKGLIDSDKFNVVDTSSSKLLSLKAAVDDAILVTPKRSLDLLETLKFNLYDPATGSFSDPFTTAAEPLTLHEAITKGLIDPSTTMVRDLNNSQIAPLPAAISSGLIDSANGRLVNDNSEPLDFVKARDKGLLLPAEQRVSSSVGVATAKPPTNSLHLPLFCLSANAKFYFVAHQSFFAHNFIISIKPHTKKLDRKVLLSKMAFGKIVFNYIPVPCMQLHPTTESCCVLCGLG